MAADSEHGLWLAPRQFEFDRCTPAPDAQRPGPVRDSSVHGVVGGAHDASIVMQECVGDGSEALGCLGVIGQNRFAADIARGRDEWSAKLRQQQFVQRTVR